jgi:ribosomal-protein-alanine N-acetyltransferase
MSAAADLSNYSLRPMTKRDLSSIIEIEKRAYPYPWPKGIFEDCMRVGYGCWVFEADDRVHAYAIVSTMVDESHIMNLTVDPEVQGRGVGRAVLRELIKMAQESRADTILLEVRPSNAAALNLYQSEGFNEIGTRKAYYPAKRGREDAVILAKVL